MKEDCVRVSNPETNPSFTSIAGDDASDVLLLCDHASNFIPQKYNSLGLPNGELERHIAYDIGAADVTRRLAELFHAPAILTNFSRLLIDPNRGLDDPTLIMKLSDGAIIPGNRYVTQQEAEQRIENYYKPYHSAISAAIDTMVAANKSLKIISLHSFTDSWRFEKRHWEIGLLWDRDNRLSAPLFSVLGEDFGVVVGDNEPYSGRLEADCMDQHGTQRGIAHVLIEIRQDLLWDQKGVEKWADLLFDAFGRVFDAAPAGSFAQRHPPKGEM